MSKWEKAKSKAKATGWFIKLLEDIETWDQYAMQSVLNDHGVIKDMTNVLIEYQQEIKSIKE